MNIDRELLLLINGSGSETQDHLWLFISYKWSWVFLYLILLVLIYRTFGTKYTLWIIVGVALAITLSDQLSVQLFKEQFQRLRPCHNPELEESLRAVRNKCGGQFGFISSHASNSMSLAILLVTVGFKKWGNPTAILIIWALVVGYSRVYLGVHYPSDVIGGCIFGALIGLGVGLGLNHFIQKKPI